MKLYKDEPRFDRRSGKQNGTERIWFATRCDFSGRLVSTSEDEGLKAYYYEINVDHGDEDSCYGACGDEFQFGKDLKIDMYAFLSEPFVVYDDAGNRSDTGETEMPAFLKALSNYEDFDQALRLMRMATLKKLIESGEVKAEELGG